MRNLPAVAAILLVACSANPPVEPRRDAGGEGIDAAVPTMPSGRCAADADCTGGLRCSAVGVCIAQGACRVAADCAAGERCGSGSQRCYSGDACGAVGDCPAGLECDLASSTCVIGGGCGAAEFEITRVRPNMMILLDRSGSMDGQIEGRTRWDIAKDAIRRVTRRFDADIRFGLATYPSCAVAECGAGRVVVPIRDTNAAAINGFLMPLTAGRGRPGADQTPPPTDYLCGRDGDGPQTSTGRSLFALVGQPSLQVATSRNYVLLITDGEESDSCTMGGMQTGPLGARALRQQDVPVRTYVVGFSRDVDAAELNQVAMRGGTMQYFPADNSAMLITALEAAASAIVSCEYQLASDPPNLESLFVFVNDQPTPLARDANGWDYDATTRTLRFNGTSCEQILAGSVADIDVVFGCPAPVLE